MSLQRGGSVGNRTTSVSFMSWSLAAAPTMDPLVATRRLSTAGSNVFLAYKRWRAERLATDALRTEDRLQVAERGATFLTLKVNLRDGRNTQP